MSRVGKMPVIVPDGIEVSIDNTLLSFKKGSVIKNLDTRSNVKVNIDDKKIVFLPNGNTKRDKAFWGTYRSLANGIVIGLTKGYEKILQISGLGYKAGVNGNTLKLLLGFSHPIEYKVPDGIEVSVNKNLITVKGDDKQLVGQTAADIRSFRRSDPYKAKGIKYKDEIIRKKAGKTAKAK